MRPPRGRPAAARQSGGMGARRPRLGTAAALAACLGFALSVTGAQGQDAVPAPTDDAAAAPGPTLDPAIFEESFCTSPIPVDEAGNVNSQEINTASMDCARLMEFVYTSRTKVLERLGLLRKEASSVSPTPPGVIGLAPWRNSLASLSHASSLLSAHAHVLAAVASQRSECFSELVRLLLVQSLRRMKGLTNGQIWQLWLIGERGDKKTEDVGKKLDDWYEQAINLLTADLRTMRTVLRTWKQPAHEDARFYSHEADGCYSTMEALRRDTFDEWQLDKGLLRGLLRDVLPLDSTIADFGAGSGHYAKWLNDTGLVQAFAYDGSPEIELVTNGAVSSADLAKQLELGRMFDWVLCLEVAEHIPPDLTQTFLRNLDAHAGEGVVISWARPGLQGMGFANPRSEQEAIDLLQQHTGLHLDADLTIKLRSGSSVPHLAESLLALVRTPRAPKAADAGDALAPASCAAEDGWIYAGNDVQMFSNVASPAACCELCTGSPECKYWTWSSEASHKDLCWIKATREYRINHEGFVSGTKPSA